jgi:hypothetical protein
MSATATEATREELIAEYVARDALSIVENRVRGLLEGEDHDILAKLTTSEASDGLRTDPRLEELFLTLWPTEEDSNGARHDRASVDSVYMAARILRTIVYHAEHLLREAQFLFELADKRARNMEEASGDA